MLCYVLINWKNYIGKIATVFQILVKMNHFIRDNDWLHSKAKIHFSTVEIETMRFIVK